MATQDIETRNGGGVTRRTVTISDDGPNLLTLRSRAAAALTANATFLAAAKPGTAAAQASAAYDQTVRLTKECNALIRLLLGLLADVSDTA